MIYSVILVITLYLNFVSSTHVKNTAEYQERVWSGHYVYKEGAYPYFCVILAPTGEGDYSPHCGGSLLTNRIMITAAHCLSNAQLIPNFRILPNYRNSRLWYPDDEVFRVADYENHPNANNEAMSPQNAHDIAVVLLDRPDNRSIEYILPPITPLLRSLPVKMIGFGETESGVASIRLKEATVHMLDEKECLDKTSRDWFSPGDSLCTSNSFGSTTCGGDSGGPLIWENPQNHKSYLIGVLSAGHKPCRAFGISIYVDVLMHLDFINNAIARLTSKEMRSDQTEYD